MLDLLQSDMLKELFALLCLLMIFLADKSLTVTVCLMMYVRCIHDSRIKQCRLSPASSSYLLFVSKLLTEIIARISFGVNIYTCALCLRKKASVK